MHEVYPKPQPDTINMSRETQEPNDSDSRPMDIEASKWAVKQSMGFTAGEQDAFFEWLAADPEHAAAFSSRRQVWDELNSLAEWRPEHSLKPNPDLLQGHSLTKRKINFSKIIVLAGSLAAVFAVGLLVWNLNKAPVPLTLAQGEFAHGYERHVLEDGSVVELNRGAQATVEYTSNARHVNLEFGEAHFTIAKDAKRPFVVKARGVAVQALGTIFNVQIRDDSVNVLVTEGRVSVDHFKTGETGAAPPEYVPSTTQQLQAGQRSVIDLRTTVPKPLIQAVSSVEIEQQLSWLKQVLSFQSTPLSDIVLEFNRRNFTQITIEDPEIMGLELTVALKPHNIDGFIELLDLTMGIQAEPIGVSTILLRKKP